LLFLSEIDSKLTYAFISVFVRGFLRLLTEARL